MRSRSKAERAHRKKVQALTAERIVPRRTHSKVCKATGKQNWATEHDAQVALVLARGRRLRTGALHVERRAYKCEHGDHWHLTSAPGRKEGDS